MAFQIPPQAFLSFSKKQAADSLWRLLRQMESAPLGSSNWCDNLVAFEKYCEVLKEHELPELRKLALTLFKTEIKTGKELEGCLVTLERFLEKDLREDQFLISVEDTEVPKGKTPASHPIIIVLDNLRSAFNVGSIFRSAEALGVSKIHLCGYTATPDNSKTAKAALGTDQWVDYQYWENTLQCLEELKERGFRLLALETEESAIPLSQTTLAGPTCIILGNERYGLSEPVLKRVDEIISIPLSGRKNSLNVAVCGAIVIHHLIST